MNSDMANMILEAKDILAGNLFLTDWNLTGILFITTDMLYFLVGVIIAGVNVKAFIIAKTLMLLAIVFSGMSLVYRKKDNFLFIAVYWITAHSFPATSTFGQVHTGCIVWCLIGLYFINRMVEEDNIKKYPIYTFILFTLAIAGDALSILVIAVPLWIVSVINIIRSKIIKNNVSPVDCLIAIICMLSVFFGMLFEKVYLKIGKANMNAYIYGKRFITWNQLSEKLNIYFEALFRMFNANFAGSKVKSISSILYFGRSCIIFVGFAILIFQLWNFLRNKRYDYVSVVLGLGFILVSVCTVMAGFLYDVWGGRYFAYTPIIFAIMITRFLENIDWKKLQWKNPEFGKRLLLISLLIFLGIEMVPIPKFKIKQDENASEIIRLLKENGLENGYGEFWISSNTTVYSNETVKVRHINIDENGIHPHKWFCKNSWYNEEANFIIIPTGSEEWKNKMVFAEKFLGGEPPQIIHAKNYAIYVYDYDISKYIS